MKKVKFLGLAIITSMLILIACNNGNKEQSDEKNESEVTEMKDTGSTMKNKETDEENEGGSDQINVPAEVKNENMKRYPESNTQNITWETENGNYEGNWGGKDGEANSVTYTPSGTFVEIVKAIPLGELPQTTNDYIKQNYQNAKFGDVGKVLDAQGKTSYEVAINGKDVIFDANGKFVKEEK